MSNFARSIIAVQPLGILRRTTVANRRNFEVDGLHHENPIPMGCVIGNLMTTSLIFGMEPDTRRFPDDIEGQCKLMFENIRRVMEAAGGTTDNIIKLVVWAKDN